MAQNDVDKAFDPEAFEETAGSSWSKGESEEKKAASRLQDLSLGVDDDDDDTNQQRKNQDEEKDKTWPFEEPCKWHGGKNTRQTAEAEAINSQYFDPDFASNAEKGAKMEFEDAANNESSSEDDSSSSSSSSDSSSTEEGNVSSDSDSSSAESFCDDEDEQQVPAKAQGSPPNQPQTRAPPAGRPSLERCSSHRMSKARNRSDGSAEASRFPQRQASFRRQGSQRELGGRMAGSSSTRPTPSTSKRDDLSASCHGSLQTAAFAGTSRSSHGSRAKDELGSSTYHTASLSRASSSSNAIPPSRNRPKPPRTKSSDGSELVGVNANTRGGQRGGKRRPSKTLSSSNKAPGERRMLKRAMSTRNVTRPEEYRPNAGGGGGAAAPAGAAAAAPGAHRQDPSVAPGRSRGSLQRAASQRVMRSESHATRPAPSSSNASSLSRSSHDGSSHHHRSGSKSSEDGERASPRRGVRRRSSGRSIDSGEAPRRDLVVLLKKQQKVTAQDLIDKENRRLLHFLMYEHKMGIPLKELHKAVREDTEQSQVAEMAA